MNAKYLMDIVIIFVLTLMAVTNALVTMDTFLERTTYNVLVCITI